MVEKVRTQEDIYIRNYMAKLPEVKKGESRVIKKGDSLWNIAREKLGKKSKREERQHYVMLIAKLNGFDTKKKMDELKMNDTIYLPEEKNNDRVTGSNKSNRFLAEELQSKKVNKPSVTKPNDVTPPNTVQKPKPVKTSAEVSFGKRLNTICDDKNIKIEKADLEPEELYSSYLYHVTTTSNQRGYVYSGKNVLSFSVNKKTNEVEEISFDDDKNINTFGYDYSLGRDNVIKSKNHYPVNDYGKITPEQRQKLDSRLLDLTKKVK